jgi:hypothetical protein
MNADEDLVPYGFQYADEPVLVSSGCQMGTQPNGTYRKDTDDWDA